MTYFVSAFFWSLFTALMGSVRSLTPLVLTRMSVGAFEAPCFPANSRVLATWFPQRERARANAIYSFGQYVGLGFLSVPLFWTTQRYGWRGLFLIVGVLGIAFSAVWWRMYRTPSDSRGVNQAELEYIKEGGGGDYTGSALALQVATRGRAPQASADCGRGNRPVRR
jgi:ACS family D-galactonate transporter-like MFS transporter